jgi:WD40 repeat protein
MTSAQSTLPELESTRAWLTNSARLARTLRGAGLIHSLGVDANWTRVTAGGTDGKLRLWALPSGKRIAIHSGYSYAPRHRAKVNAVAIRPDGSQLVSTHGDSSLRVWNAEDGTELWAAEGFSEWLPAACFRPDGQVLAVACGRELHLYQPDQGNLLAKLVASSESVASVSFHPEGKLLATGGYDTAVKLWDITTCSLQWTQNAHIGHGWTGTAAPKHNGCAGAVAFRPDGTVLASGGFDGRVKLWAVDDGAPLREWQAYPTRAQGGGVNAVAWSPDGVLLATCAMGGGVTLWRAENGEHVRDLPFHDNVVSDLRFSPDGGMLLSAGWNGKIHCVVAE